MAALVTDGERATEALRELVLPLRLRARAGERAGVDAAAAAEPEEFRRDGAFAGLLAGVSSLGWLLALAGERGAV